MCRYVWYDYQINLNWCFIPVLYTAIKMKIVLISLMAKHFAIFFVTPKGRTVIFSDQGDLIIIKTEILDNNQKIILQYKCPPNIFLLNWTSKLQVLRPQWIPDYGFSDHDTQDNGQLQWLIIHITNGLSHEMILLLDIHTTHFLSCRTIDSSHSRVTSPGVGSDWHREMAPRFCKKQMMLLSVVSINLLRKIHYRGLDMEHCLCIQSMSYVQQSECRTVYLWVSARKKYRLVSNIRRVL